MRIYIIYSNHHSNCGFLESVSFPNWSIMILIAVGLDLKALSGFHPVFSRWWSRNGLACLDRLFSSCTSTGVHFQTKWELMGLVWMTVVGVNAIVGLLLGGFEWIDR